MHLPALFSSCQPAVHRKARFLSRLPVWLALCAVLLQLFAAGVSQHHAAAQLDAARAGEWLVCTPAGLVRLTAAEVEAALGAVQSAHPDSSSNDADTGNAAHNTGFCPFCSVAQAVVFPLLALGLLKFALPAAPFFPSLAATRNPCPPHPDQRHAPPHAPPVFSC